MASSKGLYVAASCSGQVQLGSTPAIKKGSVSSGPYSQEEIMNLMRFFNDDDDD